MARSLSSDPAKRRRRALIALDGLSVGDAFGEQFFIPGVREICIGTKQPPEGPWPFTDDTVMALAICGVLFEYEEIDQAALAEEFAERYSTDPYRGYGEGAQRLLHQIAAGADWREATQAAFGGEGSLGNGGAMRAAPVGAYFADDLELVVEQARASAEITHAHPEGIAGAIAVAVAAAYAWRDDRDAEELLSFVLEHTPEGQVASGIAQALDVPLDEWEYDAAEQLGDGNQVTAADTVPFSLWCAAAHLDSYRDAIWAGARAAADIDTVCAIVGGVVAGAVGRRGIPAEWIDAREELGLTTEESDE